VWAFGFDGEVRHFDGTTWASLDPSALDNFALCSVQGFGPDDIFLLANHFSETYLVHWDGSTWNVQDTEVLLGEPLPILYQSGSVIGTSQDDLILAGDRGLVFQTTCP